MSIIYPDNLTAKQSKLSLERLQSLVSTTHLKRVARISALQMEIQEILDNMGNMLEDEAMYQVRMSILPSVAATAGDIVDGKASPNPLSTAPEFTRNNRATALASLKNENPFTDLVGSPNFTVKDPQIVLAFNQMLTMLDSVYKYLKLHEHRIKNARLLIQTKMRQIELLQEEATRQNDANKSGGIA